MAARDHNFIVLNWPLYSGKVLFFMPKSSYPATKSAPNAAYTLRHIHNTVFIYQGHRLVYGDLAPLGSLSWSHDSPKDLPKGTYYFDTYDQLDEFLSKHNAPELTKQIRQLLI